MYRKGLEVYNLGRVTVWVSRTCLESVIKMSWRCLECVWNMSETSRKVSVTLTIHTNLTYPNILLGPEILSNSNPTWNSTELELVEVGVDFVFQCHKKKKNNNNPHLNLIYRMWLQVYDLGMVRVWVSRSCLEGVWKRSGRCLESYLT